MPYPADFGDGLGGGDWDNTGFTYSPEALKAYFDSPNQGHHAGIRTPRELRDRHARAPDLGLRDGQPRRGKAGRVTSACASCAPRSTPRSPTPIPAGTCDRTEPGQPATTCAAYPGAITTAGDAVSFYDGTVFNPKAGIMYYKAPTDRTFNNVLPSMNLRYEMDKDMIVRFGASKTIGRQNYNVLGAGFGTPVCDANGCRVTGPNPDLKPLTAKNVDLSWAWYFARRSLVAVNVFHSKIDGYVKTGATGTSTVDLLDPRDQTVKTFAINSSSQQGAQDQRPRSCRTSSRSARPASASPRTSAAPRPRLTTAVRWSARPTGPATSAATSRTT